MRRNGRHPASPKRKPKTALEREDARIVHWLRVGKSVTHKACGSQASLETTLGVETITCEKCGPIGEIRDNRAGPLRQPRVNIGVPA